MCERFDVCLALRFFFFETWIYMNDGAANFYLLDARNGTTASNVYLYYDSSADSFVYQDGVGSYHWLPPDIIAAKWQHIGIQSNLNFSIKSSDKTNLKITF